MSLQKQVIDRYSLGEPGVRASQNPATYAGNKIAKIVGDVPVMVGNFVYNVATEREPYAVAAVKGAYPEPLGVVEKNLIYPLMEILATGSLAVPDGGRVNVITRGDVWVQLPDSEEAPTLGQYVYASNTDGTIKVDDSPNATISGYTFTGWKVTQATGSTLVVISDTNLVVNVTTGGE
jgi:hypothetical protein